MAYFRKAYFWPEPLWFGLPEELPELPELAPPGEVALPWLPEGVVLCWLELLPFGLAELVVLWDPLEVLPPGVIAPP